MVTKIVLKYLFVYGAFAVGSVIGVSLINEALGLNYTKSGVLAVSFIVLYCYILYTSIKSAVHNHIQSKRLIEALKAQGLKAYTIEDGKVKDYENK